MMEIVIMNIKEKKDEWQTAIRENALGDKTKKAKDNIREENYNKIITKFLTLLRTRLAQQGLVDWVKEGLLSLTLKKKLTVSSNSFETEFIWLVFADITPVFIVGDRQGRGKGDRMVV